jgi:hypothetical protein
MIRERMIHTSSATTDVKSYDEWFDELVEAELTLADSPNAEWFSHENATLHWETKRKNLLEQIKRSEA